MTEGVGTADDPWTLTPADHALVMFKRGETRLGFAAWAGAETLEIRSLDS
jgi:hypothetical protein